ncbi:unnamed protein product [Nezara viridula]|uniref:Uncharacterized protein n=1 Tax=Nezara viridula TaxID=85310 RepID=A0A9P0E8J1_NEZVI|nr:unnamed protein product [Nezara viridula]
MGVIEPFKKWKRSLDVYVSCKKSVCLFVIALFLLIYMWPSHFLMFHDESHSFEDVMNQCSDDNLIPYHDYKRDITNPFIYSIPPNENEVSFLPYVGNGFLGIPLVHYPSVYVKDKRTLSLNTKWNPVISVETDLPIKDIYITNIESGTVTRVQCIANGVQVIYKYYAHRTIPHLFYQELKIKNPTMREVKIQLSKATYPDWATSSMEDRASSKRESGNFPLHTFNGQIKNVQNKDEVVAFFVNMKAWPSVVEVKPHRSTFINIPCIIYQENMNIKDFDQKKPLMENKSKEIMQRVLSSSSLQLEQDHVDAWNKLWKTGLSISHSKAAGALNGDRINATVYYVLSSVKMKNVSNLEMEKSSKKNYISIAEGCYGGYHHTLQALRLWKNLKTFKEVNESVSLWLLTLEKQGCHKLLSLGSEGVMQAMVLSFGGFHFSAHHLEFKIDPKFLHRDYVFRRIQYDFNTFINVSVTLQDDNKALLGVAVDKTEKDKVYYACDGGCSLQPVELSSSEVYFPVKMTDPITSILYITSDKNHMELIKDTLHVHKVVEAPAYDHHVIALHRHGHHLGGLPLMFWASVIFLIVIFHLFLFKLIFNEYCGKQEKFKTRYAKV